MQRILLSKDQIRTWIADLRSGDFAQTNGTLHDETGYCCLGVLAQRLGTLDTCKHYGESDHVVYGRDVLGREFDLIDMNDTQKLSFSAIAAWIEQEILPLAPDEMVPGALDSNEDGPDA